jgi:hypothetical protein
MNDHQMARAHGKREHHAFVLGAEHDVLDILPV